MKTILSAVALALPSAGIAASDLSVLPPGRYDCWTAGSATGPATTTVPERDFAIERGSSYRNAAGGGTYLLADGLLTFTRGPLKDMRLRHSKEGFYQEIDRNGALMPLKCSRAGGLPMQGPA